MVPQSSEGLAASSLEHLLDRADEALQQLLTSLAITEKVSTSDNVIEELFGQEPLRQLPIEGEQDLLRVQSSVQNQHHWHNSKSKGNLPNGEPLAGEYVSGEQFYKSIPDSLSCIELEQRIQNLKFSCFSTRRKDELFKRFRKEQQERLINCQRQIDLFFPFKTTLVSRGQRQVTLQNPKRNRIDTLSIGNDELEKLRPDTDLNDTIIFNYIKVLQNRILCAQMDQKTFFYSSFFLQKLVGECLKEELPATDKAIAIMCGIVREKAVQNYKNVQKWTKKTDIFEKQFLVFPINAFKHWWCLIVVNPGRVLTGRGAFVVYCDSMFEKKPYIVEALKSYLEEQIKSRKNESIIIDDTMLPCYQLLLPRQTNTHDCGLYMLTYIQELLLQPFLLSDLHLASKRDKLRLFPRTLTLSFRQRLRRLLTGLRDSYDKQDQIQNVLTAHQRDKKKALDIGSIRNDDYDSINEREFRKFLRISCSGEESFLTEEEQYACRVRFYLDSDINFYEKAKI